MSSKDEAAQELVKWHFQVEPDIVEVYRFLAPDEEDAREPIKLLEVSDVTMRSGRVETFTFGGTEELPYAMQIATITPEEMRLVRERTIPLPAGWDMSRAVRFMPPPRRRWKKSLSRRTPDGPGHRRLLSKRLPASRAGRAPGPA